MRTIDDVSRVGGGGASSSQPLGHKVYAIVNYNNFSIEPPVFEAYSDMVRELVDNYYLDVTRYATSGFLRMKLGEELQNRGVAPHIYEAAAEARAHLDSSR